MKRVLYIILLLPVLCRAQAPTDTVGIDEGNFHVTWSHQAKYPVKVYWHLTKAMLNCSNPLKRSNSFKADPHLPTESNLTTDYAKSGYDQGHNFNAADDACATPELNKHCWYFTNMTPQLPNLNRITWRALDEQCRKWVKAGDDLFIECGSYGQLKTIGPHKVWIPEFCWKIVKHKNGVIDSYLMPNRSDVNQHPFIYYHTDITVIRQKTGIDSL
ncbi:MAG TPA: DNA/RNA non-specific endonuclease [Mucilaginibacter sp.]|nr:DNA/RNA non-specific endonuclease [Mucilaginibacter sp.]